MVDLEKGHRAAHPTHSPTFAFPQRRRKLIIVLLLVSSICLFVFATEQTNSSLSSSSSWKWVKDSMRPVSDKGATSLVVPSAQNKQGTEVLGDQPFEPTPALVALASKLNTPLPTTKPLHDLAETNTRPSHVDQVLLFLTAMKDESYRVPELQVHRTEELQPSTTVDFVKTLAKVKADTADQALYRQSQSGWRQKHRAQSPLTVFSKSYCPYSKGAKALLTTMGVKFDLYEVDLRDDAKSLQAGLKELSNHATFPTIFVRDELIGGFDDLSRLHRIGVLKGILEGAGVKSS